MLKSRVIAIAKAFGPAAVRDLVGLAGVAAVVRGVAMVSAPAAWIVAGLLLVAAAFLLSRRTA